SLLLLDHPDDLLLGETALPHSSAPSLGQTLHQSEGANRGQVRFCQRSVGISRGEQPFLVKSRRAAPKLKMLEIARYADSFALWN
ncbi:hypothetical protein, partial [Sphingomonas sp. ABOLE]|uniref:hypothetical protein n=1 Tax=Sphingomonas sp. ABOLE TaxID=1985878 RepID=UPI0019D2B613